MAEHSVPRVEILHVPDCPLVEPLRQVVGRALVRCGIDAEVEERVGDYPSPTLLIDGRDATGRQVGDRSACRLDVPTEEQIVASLAARSRATLRAVPGDGD